MKFSSILLLSLGLVSGAAMAGGTTEAGVGGALGGVLGSVVGQQLGGNTGSTIGAALGGAGGSAVGADKRSRREAASGGALGAAGGNVLGRSVGGSTGALVGSAAGGGAGVQVAGVDHPRDERPDLLGVPAPVATPGVLRPDRAGDERGERPDREGEGVDPVGQLVHARRNASND